MVLVYSSGFFFTSNYSLVWSVKIKRSEIAAGNVIRTLYLIAVILVGARKLWKILRLVGLEFVNSIPGMWPLKLSYGWVGRK